MSCYEGCGHLLSVLIKRNPLNDFDTLVHLCPKSMGRMWSKSQSKSRWLNFCITPFPFKGARQGHLHVQQLLLKLTNYYLGQASIFSLSRVFVILPFSRTLPRKVISLWSILSRHQLKHNYSQTSHIILNGGYPGFENEIIQIFPEEFYRVKICNICHSSIDFLHCKFVKLNV